ncbi:hypothetical protein [Sinomonas humi]|uniref:Uncharacterized protein n=1 Tax=Sinomonas humi TaxID=1338436 RepID=A0A0B2AUE5_9MICC|nr:hypothetical protein [Sinomonas humi]KHL05595.1 hypothetical protein LK10_00590 [Sinomonas humi]
MRPADISRPASFARPAYVKKDDVAEIAQGAADTIAKQIAGYAGQIRQAPITVFREEPAMVDRAIEQARAWVFDDLLRETEVWAQSQPQGSAHQMAIEQLTMMRALHDGFAASARHRIEGVLEACTAPMPGTPPVARAQSATPAAPVAPPLFAPTAKSEAYRSLLRVQQATRRCAIWASVHAGICVVGLFISILTYESAAPGGRYVVWWGAIVFGAINCIRYGIAYSRNRAAAAQIEQRIGAS